MGMGWWKYPLTFFSVKIRKPQNGLGRLMLIHFFLRSARTEFFGHPNLGSLIWKGKCSKILREILVQYYYNLASNVDVG